MINPREMRRLMRQLKAKEIDAYEIIIKTAEGDYIIEEPQVMAMEIQGQKMLQVIGEMKKIEVEKQKEEKPLYTEEDVQLVMQQTGCSEEEAKKALEEANGEPAEAIISIMSRK
ncbi:MAG TPA: ubiquitin [Aciduliprofundum boonei]|uniref:Nascent polypeptide-associated complex protein n=1 Tax=Candidatus Aciduliprofundum boonei TaxID=379547 RepID=A0A7J3TAM5_9ARCH|nr:ubiquitin [Candidatus Aciduliprofundum boonei]